MPYSEKLVVFVYSRFSTLADLAPPRVYLIIVEEYSCLGRKKKRNCALVDDGKSGGSKSQNPAHVAASRKIRGNGLNIVNDSSFFRPTTRNQVIGSRDTANIH